MTFLLSFYVFIMDYAGFIIATFIFLMLAMYLFGERNLKKMFIISLVASLIVFLLFTKAFMIVLPGIPGFDA